jgi:hypothetical protein
MAIRAEKQRPKWLGAAQKEATEKKGVFLLVAMV